MDLGAYSTLYVQTRVVKAGTDGTITIQHAATTEEGAFRNLGSGVSLDATTNDVETQASFLRYVRYVTNSSVAGSPVVGIDLVAKES